MAGLLENRIKKHKIKFLQALEKSLGIITPACKAVNIDRETYYRWYKNDDNFKLAVDNINELQFDFVEGKLFELINEKNTPAVIFYIKSKGKKKGYNDSIDITSGGQPIQKPLFGDENLDKNDQN